MAILTAGAACRIFLCFFAGEAMIFVSKKTCATADSRLSSGRLFSKIKIRNGCSVGET